MLVYTGTVYFSKNFDLILLSKPNYVYIFLLFIYYFYVLPIGEFRLQLDTHESRQGRLYPGVQVVQRTRAPRHQGRLGAGGAEKLFYSAQIYLHSSLYLPIYSTYNYNYFKSNKR